MGKVETGRGIIQPEGRIRVADYGLAVRWVCVVHLGLMAGYDEAGLDRGKTDGAVELAANWQKRGE